MKPKRAKRIRSGSSVPSEPFRPTRPRHPVVEQTPAAATGAAEPEAMHAVYDVGMVDELRGLWRRGQWSNLASMSAADLEAHPERARLAMLVAAGHQATGNRAGVAHFVQLATRWGASKESIARTLLAGVHNTLGRAAAVAGARPSSVYRHFEQSVSFCGMRPVSESMVQARLDAQLPPQARGVETRLSPIEADAPVRDANLSHQIQALRVQLETATAALQTRVDRLLPAVTDVVRREAVNGARQIEAHANLQAFLNGKPLMPDLHGWPVSPDLAVHLVRAVSNRRFDAVVEFGSGASTQLIAWALRRRAWPQAVRQVAFEHLEVYQRATIGLLQEFGLEAAADVVLAPLRPQALPDVPAPYYACDGQLAELARQLAPDCRLLVLVDGPPASTGPLARRPALQAVRRHFGRAELVILLDDYRRDDEREVVRHWCADLDRDGVPYQTLELDLDKGALELTVNPQNEGSTA